MPFTVNDMLSIRFPENRFADFYLYDLTLSEGIAELYCADAVILSDTYHTYEQLAEALSLKAEITVTQRLNDSKTTRTRYFSGIVTGISHAGVFYGSDKQDCYCYRLTIEPEMSRLRHVVRKAAYTDKTPLDVIAEILSEYGIVPNFSEEFISRRPFNTFCIYNQETESDYCFLKRLLSLYGLSFMFRHKKAPAGGFGETELYFSAGELFPEGTDISYSDGRPVPSVSDFDFRSSDEIRNLWKLDRWTMENKTGFDGVLLQVSYPNANVGSAGWKTGKTNPGDRRRIYTKHFHSYAREISKEMVDADVRLILNAQLRAFEICRESWKGAAENLLPTPGRLIRIRHFYGQHNDSVLQAMVTKSMLRCRSKWPQSFAVSPDMSGEQEKIKAVFEAMNYGPQAVKRFCPEAAKQEG